MRSHVYRSAIAPAQGYICPSCRYRIGRYPSPAKRRYQHHDGSPQNDRKANTLASTIADRLRALISDGAGKQSEQIPSPKTMYGKKSGKLGREPSTDMPDAQTTVEPTRDAEKAAISKAKSVSKHPKNAKVSKAQDASLAKQIENATKSTEQAIENFAGATNKFSTKGSKQPGAINDTEKKEDAKISKNIKTTTKGSRQNPGKAKDEETTTTGKRQQKKTPQKKTAKRKRVRKVEQKKPVIHKVQNKAPAINARISSPKFRKLDSNPKGLVDVQEPSLVAPRTTGISKSSLSVIEMISAADLNIKPIEVEQPRVPSLAYGLERVLFNPGVYQLQDPRSRVYNFDPYLQKIMPIAEFDFNALREYITSSRDQSLQSVGKSQGKRYVGSTSSMSAVLAHFHFLLSQWRPINISMLSKSFPNNAFLSFTELQRVPQAIFLRQMDGCYAIDADKQFDTSNVLSMLGKSMEKLLTLETQDFERYRRSNSDVVSEQQAQSPESYHYSTLGDFLMRSQLDAHDPRLPGTGMFDLKTRAVVSVRMDVTNYEHGTGYEIKTPQGEYESYEREYYDMIRAAFLKYSMQVRMGRMDGIFVAFHNVERIFGFQYISLAEMDNTIHGQWDTSIGDQEFKLSLDLLNKVLNKATKKYPNTSIRLHFETRDAATPFMYIFAEPVTEEQVADLQNANLASAQEFERNVLGRDLREYQGPKWEDIHANVERTMDEDEQGLDENEASAEARDELNYVGVLGDGKLSSDTAEEEEGDEIDAAAAMGGENSEDDAEEEEEEDDEDDQEEEGDEEEEEDEDEDEEGEKEEEEENHEYGEDKQSQEDVGDSNEHKEDRGRDADDCVEEKDLVNQGNVLDVEERNFSELKTDSPLGDDVDKTSDGAASKSAGERGHSSDSGKDLEGVEGHNESEPSEAISPTATDPAMRDSAFLDGIKDDSDFGTEADRPFLDDLSPKIDRTQSNTSPDDILAMTLSLRNKINGQHVLRPTDMTSTDKWEVEYLLEEVPDQSRAKALYEACKLRRRKKLDSDTVPEGEEAVLSGYVRRLRDLSEKGRAWRKEMDQKDGESGKPINVLGNKTGITR